MLSHAQCGARVARLFDFFLSPTSDFNIHITVSRLSCQTAILIRNEIRIFFKTAARHMTTLHKRLHPKNQALCDLNLSSKKTVRSRLTFVCHVQVLNIVLNNFSALVTGRDVLSARIRRALV